MALRSSQKALLYREFAKLLQAGFGIDKAADTLLHQSPPVEQRRFAESLKAGLGSGRSIAESVGGSEVGLSELERRILDAGERGGRLEEAFAHLANYFEMTDRTVRAIRRRLVYPLVLVHAAVILPAVPRALFRETGAAGFVASVAWQLAVVYLIGALLLVGWRWLARAGRRSATIDRSLNALPLIGRVRRSLSLTRFCKVFEIFLLSGRPPSEGVRAAGDASQAGALMAAGRRLEDHVRSGQPLGTGLRSEPAIPEALARSLATAEEAGSLEKDLHRWSVLMEGRAEESLERFGDWAPKVIYGVAVLFMAWQLVSLYMGYLSSLESMLPWE